MIIIKIEVDSGGTVEFHDFDTKQQAAIFLAKNPDYKLRLVATVDNLIKQELKGLKKLFLKRILG